MSNVRVVLNSQGVRELLQSAEIAECCREVGERVRNNAGDGYSMNMRTGKNRAICRVFANSKKAVSDNYKNNTLLKALH